VGIGERELRGFLVGRLARQFGVSAEQVDPDRLLEQYGVSSRDAVAITGELAELLDRPLRPESLWRYPTVNQMVRGLLLEGREIAVVGSARRPGNGSNVALAIDARPGEESDGFDAEFFGAAPDGDTALLEVRWDALENAGIAPRSVERIEEFVDPSPLVAAHAAVQSLRAGKSDVAVAAAVGDGCAVVVLKRLPDAERDGNQVLAQLSGTASEGLPAACADAGVMLTEVDGVETAAGIDGLLETVAKGNRLTAVSDATNTHVVVRPGHRPLADSPLQRVGHFVLSDITHDRVREYASALADHLGTGDEWLADIAYTLAGRLGRGPVRAAVVARDRGELLEGLRALAEDRPHQITGQVAQQRITPVWVFSGDQPKWTGLRSLVESEPEFAAAVNELDPLLRWASGLAFRDAVITGMPPGEGQLAPALYGVQVALALLWRQYGVTPAAIVGESTGELAAAVLAGALTVTEGAQVIAGQATAESLLRDPRLPYYRSVPRAARDGHRVFTEISLHPLLGDKINADLVTSTLRQDQDPAIAFHRQLATLEVHGLPLTRRPGRIIDLPAPRWRRQ
jgi:acyl transferase domain-containing protein/acyl carrier protein